MKNKQMDDGMTLVEVMIALVIIVGIVTIAYQYHMTIVMSNRVLLQRQEALVSEENQFDQNYTAEY